MSADGPASEFLRRKDRARVSRTNSVLLIEALFIVMIFFAYPAWYVFSAKQESETYNRLTGAHTTWWDALWVELRVQELTQKQP